MITFPPIFAAIADATQRARARTGDRTLAVQAHQGRGQVTRVTFRTSGASDVAPVTDWMPLDDVPAALDSIN